MRIGDTANGRPVPLVLRALFCWNAGYHELKFMQRVRVGARWYLDRCCPNCCVGRLEVTHGP